jgi:O-methyltransferase involved in polyketide biosynthesis
MNQRAVVSWIGVTMYLVREAINATLESVASLGPGTRIVVSFDQPPDVLDEKGRALLSDVSGTAAKFGEPFLSLLRRDEIERMLVHHGFSGVTHFGVGDAIRRYYGGVDVGMPDVQRLATAVIE